MCRWFKRRGFGQSQKSADWLVWQQRRKRGVEARRQACTVHTCSGIGEGTYFRLAPKQATWAGINFTYLAGTEYGIRIHALQFAERGSKLILLGGQLEGGPLDHCSCCGLAGASLALVFDFWS